MRRERRAVIAVIVGLCGIAIVAGARIGWIGSRGARPASGVRDTALSGILHWSYQPCRTFLGSFGFAVIVGGVLVFLGGLLASRLLTAVFAFLTLVAAGLWIALNASHYSHVNLTAADLRPGAWLVGVGGVLALLLSPLLRKRRAPAPA